MATQEGCGGLESTHLYQFLLLKNGVVFKELILTVYTLGGWGGLERTEF